jgi:hypothetical protein
MLSVRELIRDVGVRLLSGEANLDVPVRWVHISGKVEELTGRSLSSARDRIEFWLALRGRELVAPAGDRGAS